MPGRYRIICRVFGGSSVNWFRLYRNNTIVYYYKDQKRVLYELPPESPQESRAIFSVQEEGQYTCQYVVSSVFFRTYFSPVSHPVTVRDLPKPAISVEKDLGETERYRITCSEATISTEKQFTLCKGQHQKNITYEKDGAGTLSHIFILPRNAADTYWCIYLIIGEWLESPFSDPVVISEDVKLQTGPDFTQGNLVRIGLAVLVLILLLFFIAEAFHGWMKRRQS
uniref:Uncharacterized protein LOC117368273 n=1 Tax=Geotrypetes seraphini TaxID=260995 RepID=A0A6P8SFN0_GEOSA|nr:uncharacterized protein LOC117368273 [Geotrypetes seraphini]